MKKIFYCSLLLLSTGMLTLTSCYDDNEDKLEVFLPGSETGSGDAAKKIATYNSYMDRALKEALEDTGNPDNIVEAALLPDGYVKLSDGTYVGYVDLGLSHKWAVGNLRAGSTTATEFQTIEEYLGLDGFERIDPGIAEGDDALVAYKDYKSGNYGTDYSAIVDEYETKAKNYVGKMANEKSYYFNYLWQTKYYFLNGSEAAVNPLPDTDMASLEWGDKWATPSRADIEELYDKCQLQNAVIRGSKGTLVTGPSGKALFLPLAWGIEGSSYGLYMCTDKDEEGATFTLVTSEKSAGFAYLDRPVGYSLRPVLK